LDGIFHPGIKQKGNQIKASVNPVRNSSGALNPAGIIIKPNPAAEQRGIISNGVNITLAIIKVTSGYKFQTAAYRTDFS
jgi:hypothetical protein